jgi:hypothetical protein
MGGEGSQVYYTTIFKIELCVYFCCGNFSLCEKRSLELKWYPKLFVIYYERNSGKWKKCASFCTVPILYTYMDSDPNFSSIRTQIRIRINKVIESGYSVDPDTDSQQIFR